MGWWHYLLLVNFYLVLFFVFYALLLSKETFFNLNRVYLVVASLLSFFIPLIQSNWVKGLFITQRVQYTIYNSSMVLYKIKPVERVLTLGNVLEALYLTGAVFLTFRLLWQLIILRKAIEKPQPSSAYSFFKKISLGNNLSNADVIAEHEQVHANQWHSIDVLIIEMVMIINWFNPVVYLYRFAIKYIHEFIADREVLQAGTDKADYALLLLSQTFDTSTNGLASNFYNSSLLKQRVIMLQKSRSKRIALAKYGLLVPLFMLMLIFSSATVSSSKAVAVINKNAENVFLTPASPSAIVNKLQHPQLVSSLNSLTRQEILSAVEDNYIEQNRDDIPLAAISNRFTDITNKENEQVVFMPGERQPQFPGGMEKFYEILRTNLHYPDDMRKSHIEGKAIIQFVVEQDGSVTDIKTLRAPGYGSEEESERVITSLPKWIPGYQNGHPVSVKYIIPIDFKMEIAPALPDTTSANVQSVNNASYIATTVRQQPAAKQKPVSIFSYLGDILSSIKTVKNKNI